MARHLVAVHGVRELVLVSRRGVGGSWCAGVGGGVGGGWGAGVVGGV
ncbi:hypothetical protein OJ963_35890 [Streptomyces sp. RS2]|nr:hypothetical protein [Streptomyces sp. RS2]MCW1099203.1 hypothetical protein [Streptomyces sp. RS2]